MVGKDEMLKFRKKQWDALCEKYRIRGEQNTVDYLCSDVNYALFAKPKILRTKRTKLRNPIATKVVKKHIRHRKKVNQNLNATNYKITSNYADIAQTNNKNSFNTITEEANKSTCIAKEELLQQSDLGDLRASMHDVEQKSNYVQKLSKDLIKLIEVDLNSKLKDMLIYRSESKILDLPDYNYWHKSTKNEMTRLHKFITELELKEYMRYCDKVSVGWSKNLIHVLEKSLKDLIVKREFAKNDTKKYNRYCTKLREEWQRLSKCIDVTYMISYASWIVNVVNQNKNKISSQVRASKDDTSNLGEKESYDSGFITV